MATVFDSLRFISSVEGLHEGNHKILFAAVPDAEKLCCIVASYDDSEKPSSYYSLHSWTILKCRKLIFTTPELIATPEVGGLRQIYIIISKEFYTLNKLQPKLKALGLSFQRPTFVVKNTYEACLRYTISARIAPCWNLVGNHFIYGREFLSSNSAVDSVRVEISIVGNQFQLVMWPTRVVMSPLIFDAFRLMDDEEDSENQVLDLESYNIQVYILPSMKTGTATYLQTKIPEESPFKSYKDIRRYWKNVYGYRLPEHEDQKRKVLFVTVKFNKMHPGLTYPICCLRSTPAISIKTNNESNILLNFLSDITGRIPNICGYPFSSNAYVGVAINKLVHPSSISENSNLASTFPLKEFLKPLYPIFLSDDNNNDKSMVNINSKSRNISFEEKNKTINPIISWPMASANSNTSSITTITITTTTSSNVVNMPHNHKYTDCSRSSNSSLLPISLSSHPLTSSIVTHVNTKLPDQLKGYCSEIETKKTEEQFGKQTSVYSRSSNSEKIKIAENYCRPKYAPAFYPCPRTTVKPVATSFTSYFNALQGPRSSENIATKKPSSFMNNNFLRLNSPVKETMPMSSLLKRETCSITTYESGAKKRSRPQVQADVDVSAMARSPEGLARVNTTTLIAYLRSKGIPCKVKDKKGDLVAKVMAYLKN